ncbi:hypothetical protein JCGZ_22611 [Jatropha curcas]|uniref:Protein kinase domain-containing protein n=1 Tax=Jatropha curcas TaxID=180498 RepID=A0A067JM62_JATCU|nr:uncharacterized protein LOC105646172 [Jatropha curcas]XP_012087367.1 uncharacterized protein LOC105646172 [Jatropha curcas]XP_020539769.1 uncharacterized protein LOC105646172 [Jatropha curcas]KDP25076.1 hypothetical protein JCGZ_22611 [Jatropha curcas]
MERNLNNIGMEKPDMHKQLQHGSREPGHEGLPPASQVFMRDPTSSRNTNVRVPDLNVPEVKPVLNYSIQTGEEFALEFMRDRVNHKIPLIPNTVGDPNYATGYMELKGILGISHTGSESGSDISMLTIVEKGPKEFERTNSLLHEERSNYGSVQSVPRTSSGYGSRGPVLGYTSSGTSDSLSGRMKVLCSFGGKILPRPSDGKLRYVGGQTRIIRISKDISWRELKQKTLAIYDQVNVIKYQLPGEDLDALVSVSSDEDLLNMMEEWNEVEDREGSQKLRMFLFSMSDLDEAQFGLDSVEGDSEVQYVVAVNGMDFGSRRNSTLHGLASSSGNNLDELDRINTDRETARVATVSVGVSTLPLIAQPILQSSYSAYETHPQVYHGQVIDHGQNQHLLPHNQNRSSDYFPVAETPHSIPGHINQQGGLNEGQTSTSFQQVHNSQTLIKEEKTKADGSVQQDIDPGKTHPIGNVYPVPIDEAQLDLHSLPSKNEGNCQESVKVSSSVDAVNPVQVPKSCEDDQCSTADDMFGPGNADSVSNLIDLNYPEPSVPTQRVYYSERIPRDQAEFLNRLSKSDDSLGSQLLSSIAESVEKLHQSNLAPQMEHSVSTSKPPYADTQTVNDGLAQLQKYKEFADAVSQMNKNLSDSEDVDSGLQQAIPSNLDGKDSVDQDEVLKTNRDTGYNRKAQAEETGEVGSGHLAVHQVTAAVPDPASKPSDPKRVEITGKDLPNHNNGIPSVGVLATKQADISIDINDRFPQDFLSEIFTRGVLAEDTSAVNPIQKDGPGVSVNMENHEPKHWSYFQKLAQEGFVQKDVSLIDQDRLGTPPALAKIEEGDQNSYHFAPLTTDGISMTHEYSQLDFGEDIKKNLPGMIGADSVMLSDFDPSQVQDSESMQFDAMMENLKSPESCFEGANIENRNVGLPPLDPSLVDIDINALQIIKNDDLEELRELGSGTFGTVYHGKWRGSDVAIKRLKKICFTGRSSEQERLTLEFWREAEILSKLHHPNVVAFYGVVQDGPGGTLATVTEYMVDGSLRHVLLKKDKYLDRRKRLLIAMDAAFGMEYLHSKNIVHFDLKCDNLLVNLKDPQRPICKVGDFGLSKIKRNTLVSGGVRGTLPWMAPELLNGSSNKVSEKVDVFSFGIVLWEILTGDEPYANMHYGAIIGGIVNNTLRPTIPSFCDPEWKRLMEQCWAPNPAVRPSFSEIAGRLRVMSTAAGQTKGHGNKISK